MNVKFSSMLGSDVLEKCGKELDLVNRLLAKTERKYIILLNRIRKEVLLKYCQDASCIVILVASERKHDY